MPCKRTRKRKRPHAVACLQDTRHLPDVIVTIIQAFAQPHLCCKKQGRHEGATTWQECTSKAFAIPIPFLIRIFDTNWILIPLNASWGNSVWAAVSESKVVIIQNTTHIDQSQSQSQSHTLYQPRVNHQACCIADKLYIVGGTCSGTGKSSADIEIFDYPLRSSRACSIDSWATTAKFRLGNVAPLYLHICTNGGIREGRSEEAAERGVLRFNCQKYSWSISERLHASITNKSHTAVPLENSIFIVGSCYPGYDELMLRTFRPTRTRTQWVRDCMTPSLLLPCQSVRII